MMLNCLFCLCPEGSPAGTSPSPRHSSFAQDDSKIPSGSGSVESGACNYFLASNIVAFTCNINFSLSLLIFCQHFLQQKGLLEGDHIISDWMTKFC